MGGVTGGEEMHVGEGMSSRRGIRAGRGKLWLENARFFVHGRLKSQKIYV